MKANWIQIAVMLGFILSLCASAHLHGKPKTGNHNFWGTLIGVILQILFFWYIGFFDSNA